MEYVAENKATSDFAKRLDEAVEAIKNGEGWRIEYMQLKEKMDKHYNAGLAEGRKEGLEEGHDRAVRNTAITMLSKGKYTREEIAECSGLSVSDVEKLEKEISK